jgi:folate-binding protein YgfZ
MATEAIPELESQYRALRERVGIVDRSERGKLDVLGPDTVDFLQGQVTNDVEALEPGQGCYATVLNPKGKILADLRVLMRSADELWLDTEAAAIDALCSTLDRYRIGRQVELAGRTSERAILSLIGPGARELIGVEVALSEHAFLDAEIEAVTAVVVATDLGLDLMLAAADAERVLSALVARGAVVADAEAAEIVRIESGRPRYGRDMTADNLPGEVGLERRAVSFTKGCYVGQEPVARMHHRGHPNRHLRGLRLSAPAAPGEALLSGNRDVGRVTSSCSSPDLGPIALAIVRREVEPEDQVLVGDARLPANVIELPFEQPG